MTHDDAIRMPLPLAKEAMPTGAFARVEVYHDATAILAAWAALEIEAPRSIYQTRDWVLPWIETLGRKSRIAPLFVLARAPDDRPVALLCFGIATFGPFRIARWIGGKDSNLNIPLMRADTAWTRDDLRRLLRDIRKSFKSGGPDVFFLANQPFEWSGARNPFALLPHQASPSDAYGTDLASDPASLFASKLSKAARKKLRRKEEKLAELGAITHLCATRPDEQTAIIDAFFAMKINRLREQKMRSAYESPEMRAFVEKASEPCGRGIELHALDVGGRIVAVYGGGAAGGQWSAMFNAFEAEEQIARASPGDILLRMVIAKACADGLTRFDLGIGKARYKTAFCNEQIALFDTFVAMTVKGRLLAAFLSMWQHLKRFVKNDAKLFALAERARGALPL